MQTVQTGGKNRTHLRNLQVYVLVMCMRMHDVGVNSDVYECMVQHRRKQFVDVLVHFDTRLSLNLMFKRH